MPDALPCCSELLVILIYRTNIMKPEIDLSENIMFLLQSLLIHIQGNTDNFEMVCKVLK